MMRTEWLSPIFIVLGTVFVGCQSDIKDENLDVPFEINHPSHFPSAVYRFDNNPPTRTGYELGKRLFFDPILSADKRVSCGTCHAASAGFADPRGEAVSRGVFNRVGARNTPALANLIWYPYFNQDGGINHIEVQPVAPLNDSVEMGIGIANAVDVLQHHPDYPALFARAFGSDSITATRILWALTQFMGMLVSDNAPIDDYYKNVKPLPKQAERGRIAFNNYCAGCHSGVLQTDFSFRNNGLGMGSRDIGRAEITGLPSDEGRFRVPSLRNIAFTGPYMHHGKISTLKEVIDAYSESIEAHENLDARLPVGGFKFSQQQRDELHAFLLQLSDIEFINQPF
jgi:cytochrome c peroxidase